MTSHVSVSDLDTACHRRVEEVGAVCCEAAGQKPEAGYALNRPGLFGLRLHCYLSLKLNMQSATPLAATGGSEVETYTRKQNLASTS